ncbi:hypothetical protein PJF56_19090 [Roseofilum sp. BLCC_M91]|uniref:Uncharacterized protein n=1 Tax=Roseofilum halophilum BLCC-M91 TaxID=3022259 RepID=A0ABT7BP62_9CYAN|nr:hypothetical protein [Roseofilum halophilum]MDJ1180969.1 hypothetical protein [Roseofilum halophilum BLCC-M91]
MKFSYFVGGVMGLAIASTALFGASAQGCFLNKSFGEGTTENQPPDTPISQVAHPHTHNGANPLAVVAGLAGIGGLGAAGMMLKNQAAAQVNAEVSETPELNYEVETVVTDVTVEAHTDREGSDRTLTSVG